VAAGVDGGFGQVGEGLAGVGEGVASFEDGVQEGQDGPDEVAEGKCACSDEACAGYEAGVVGVDAQVAGYSFWLPGQGLGGHDVAELRGGVGAEAGGDWLSVEVGVVLWVGQPIGVGVAGCGEADFFCGVVGGAGGEDDGAAIG